MHVGAFIYRDQILSKFIQIHIQNASEIKEKANSGTVYAARDGKTAHGPFPRGRFPAPGPAAQQPTAGPPIRTGAARRSRPLGPKPAQAVAEPPPPVESDPTAERRLRRIKNRYRPFCRIPSYHFSRPLPLLWL